MSKTVPPDVLSAYDEMPEGVREQLLGVRAVIFEVADGDPRIGMLTETLKWGQPSYLTAETKAGTTVRLGIHSSGAGAVFVHCQTTLADEIRMACGDALVIDGARAIVLPDGALPAAPLRLAIHAALTYHVRKRQ
ncbi:MAG: DUF1801 domain-containing protein [Pseudomonadota bacterium]